MITSKISNCIFNNDNFRQLVCHSVKLDLSNDIFKMQVHIDKLERNYATLQIIVNESQNQAQNLQHNQLLTAYLSKSLICPLHWKDNNDTEDEIVY